MKYIYMVFGFMFILLGLIGIFLPILPTVPFLLIGSFCLGRSSKKIYQWFKNTSIYKNNLEEYEKNKSMTMKTKIKILSIATLMLGIVFLKYDILPMRVGILILIIIKYYYFIKVIRTSVEK